MINDLNDFEKRVAEINHYESYHEEPDDLDGVKAFFIVATFLALIGWSIREYQWHNRFVNAHPGVIISKS